MKYLIFLLAFFPSAALAVNPCLNNPRIPREIVVSKLLTDSEEFLIWQGLVSPPNNKYLFELFASDKGSWTIVITNVQSRSCIVGDGDHWLQHEAGEILN
jgi:hypothetical protein